MTVGKRLGCSELREIAPLGGMRRVLYVEPDGGTWSLHRASMLGEPDCVVIARGRLMRMVAIARRESGRCGLPALIVMPDGETRSLPTGHSA